MKRQIELLPALCMALSLATCGQQNTGALTEAAAPAATVTPATTPTAAPEPTVEPEPTPPFPEPPDEIDD